MKHVKRQVVECRGNYSHKTGTIRAAKLLSGNARPYLLITKRQHRDAHSRLCYAGTDYLRLSNVPGYGDWEPLQSGAWVASKEGDA